MRIKIKETDPSELIRALKIHWDSRSNQYVGNMIDFIDELFKQSGYSVICYHFDGLGCPISITENKRFKKEDDEKTIITELEIEDIIDEQLAIIKEDGTQTNIWYGKYSHDSELIKFVKKRYKYYFKLGLEELEQS
ncbi:MAG: hypothetical protein ACTSO9_21855 [Candidatus Helarchaeota archaeon]